jgi:hypothetical protein
LLPFGGHFSFILYLWAGLANSDQIDIFPWALLWTPYVILILKNREAVGLSVFPTIFEFESFCPQLSLQ